MSHRWLQSGRLLALLENIRLGWNRLAVIYSVAVITLVKSFIMWTKELRLADLLAWISLNVGTLPRPML